MFDSGRINIGVHASFNLATAAVDLDAGEGALRTLLRSDQAFVKSRDPLDDR